MKRSSAPPPILALSTMAIVIGGLFSCSSEPAPGCPDSLEAKECDIRETDCQRLVFCLVDRTRGSDHPDFPPVRFIDEREYAEYLAAVSAPPSADSQHWDAILDAFGLIPDGSTLDLEWLKIQLAYMVAYYSPGGYEIVFVERSLPNTPLREMSTLAHEYVHLLQDREHDLEALWNANVHSQDSDLSARTLVEGEAGLYQTLLKLEVWNKEPDSVDWEALYADQLSEAKEQTAGSTTPLVTAAITLPYPLGAGRVTSVWRTNGPLGVARLFDDMPPTMRSWMDDASASFDGGVSLDVPSAPKGYTFAFEEQLGAAVLFAFATHENFSIDEAWNAALDWRGDRITTFRTPDNSSHVGIWDIEWASAEAAQRFADAWEAHGDQQFELSLHKAATRLLGGAF